MSSAYQQAFSSRDQFLDFIQGHPQSRDPAHVHQIVKGISERGTLQTRRFGSQPVVVIGTNYREGIQSMGMPTRCFAMLDLLDEHTGGNPDARILCLEGLTAFAAIMRSLYPRSECSEYAPTEEEQRRIAPVPHVDVHAIQFGSGSFDAVVSGDVFEHVPFLDKALSECRRILRPEGQLIATFPFAAGLENIIQRAVLMNGEVRHLIEPPEYHGNPVRPEEGALVFQVPAWDILAQCRAAGFKTAQMLYIADPERGIMQTELDGLFVLRAVA
ncbi:MAG: class I SAM-dependent methyltransferase [Verrucomicrobiaceae bacterium]|nr:MAG: class I SAM-dependent methyltransferase [Verrucomicrobiaceae bacterium]